MGIPYNPVPREYTQDYILKMIQSVLHLKYYIPRRSETRQDGFEIEFDGTRLNYYPTAIDFGLGEGTKGYLKQIKWELNLDSDAIIPRVINLTPLDEAIRVRLGPVLRYWLDHTE